MLALQQLSLPLRLRPWHSGVAQLRSRRGYAGARAHGGVASGDDGSQQPNQPWWGDAEMERGPRAKKSGG